MLVKGRLHSSFLPGELRTIRLAKGSDRLFKAVLANLSSRLLRQQGQG